MLCFFVSFYAFSQKNKVPKTGKNAPPETVIRGEAPRFAGEQLRVYAYRDLITYQEMRIGETKIDTSGKFRVAIPVSETMNIRLSVCYSSGEMYAEPGKTYEMYLDTAGGGTDERANPNLLGAGLSMLFKNLPENDLNKLIYDFDILFSDFTYTHFTEIYKRRNKNLVDSLLNRISAEFSPITNDFFKNYINYRVAMLAQTAFKSNRYKLFNKYIAGKPILYNNPEYMAFFNQMFAMTLYGGIQQTSFYHIADIINSDNGYVKMTEILGKDSMLRDETIRDLVLIKGLGELYTDNNIKPENIISLLMQIGKESKFPKHREIAFATASMLKKFEKGSTAPVFSLEEETGQSISKTDFKGKYLFIFFWNTTCTKCLMEIEVISKLSERFGKEVSFLGINTDLNRTRYQHFSQSHTYPFRQVYFNNDFNILDDFGVKALPFYILLDRNGNILKYPAPSPSENLEGFIELAIKGEKKQ